MKACCVAAIALWGCACSTPQPTARAVQAAGSPAPIGPYSPAIARGDFLFVSGQTGRDPSSGVLVSGGIGAQTTQVLANVRALLAAEGLDFQDVVLVNVYLIDLGEFDAFNKIYAGAFSSRPPARATIGVAALPGGARVELQCTAMRP